MKASEEIFKVGFEQLGDVPFSKWTDMAKIAPEMLRLSSYRSVYSLVSKFFRDTRLRVVFSFHPLLIGGNPFTASSIYCLIAFLERRWGVHFALGGTGRLVDGLVRLIEGQGGSLRCNAGGPRDRRDQRRRSRRAARSRARPSKPMSSSPMRIPPGPIAISLPASARSRWTDRRIERARYSMSLFVWYFGTLADTRACRITRSCSGRATSELLTDIFDRKVLADDFSLYLHRPTATDASLAPDGCDAFYVLSPVPHLQSGTDWSVVADDYRQAIAARTLQRPCCPVWRTRSSVRAC